ncbi:hypothetical protein P152DRAFT_74161 [Eremomyces bilateralis CBS 781.70]|uniref:FDF domain-containing protein n=1 Tax=Eremomyces bilateralis CBS 781.70 TaxID=1392243 RepID=A0A6G1FZ14_9PEZI|nr:uncharacterized protein P152DRAFT_74161 [Eremomyces bilateralis CBS 781.70]KAF1811018.1 hypothetical protein P152DRAFT_74161 [Eremomyces bilateralis CBS 781.70]
MDILRFPAIAPPLMVPPPGWYPPPGQGFPPGPFPNQPSQLPPGAPAQQQQAQQDLQGQKPDQGPSSRQATAGPATQAQTKPAELNAPSKPSEPRPAATRKPQGRGTPTQPTPSQAPPNKAPAPPIESKPDVTSALAPSQAPTAQAPAQPSAPTKTIPTGPKGNRIVPAVPIPSAVAKPPAAVTQSTKPATQPSQAVATATQQYQNATAAATAAVAAAMAKLPAAPGQKILAQAAGDPRSQVTGSTGPSTFPARGRGARRGSGPSGHHVPGPKIETTPDFDFESANKKFSKLDLAKEAIATGSPLGESPINANSTIENGESKSTNGTEGETKSDDVTIPPPAPAYDKGSSFFDNLSSDRRDREERKDVRDMRTEERRRNMETFGQGSVDSRGGFRGSRRC